MATVTKLAPKTILPDFFFVAKPSHKITVKIRSTLHAVAHCAKYQATPARPQKTRLHPRGEILGHPFLFRKSRHRLLCKMSSHCPASFHARGAADSKTFLSSQHEELAQYLNITPNMTSKAFVRATQPAFYALVPKKYISTTMILSDSFTLVAVNRSRTVGPTHVTPTVGGLPPASYQARPR